VQGAGWLYDLSHFVPAAREMDQEAWKGPDDYCFNDHSRAAWQPYGRGASAWLDFSEYCFVFLCAPSSSLKLLL
jgi:hypothetical protein